MQPNTGAPRSHLVTGGSGFLGNLIARRLLERGERVKVLDLWEDPSRPREIQFIQCDIRDRQGVLEAMRGVEVVHHNAALVPLTKAGHRFREVNVEGSRIAAEAAVRAGVRAFIHMSSSAIFGVPGQCPITEAAPLRPAEVYGRAKLAGEMAVRQVCGQAGLPLIVIRPRTILGEGRLGIFQILFDWIRAGRNVYVIGPGDGLFQFVHACDLMDAYLLALDHGQPGDYNVGAERFGSVRQALEHLIAYAGSSSKVKSLPARPDHGLLARPGFPRPQPVGPLALSDLSQAVLFRYRQTPGHGPETPLLQRPDVPPEL